ncbi:MAG: RagB/SusD family nutrient uptake outer membrane protein [Balneolaceae bacterium]|jgi:hypothetical protein
MFRQTHNIIKGCMVLLIGAATLLSSCTDLTESIDNQVTSDQFFKTDQQFISALGDAYGPLSTWGSHNGWTSANHISSDEGIITQKGTDWYDGGIWIHAKRQNFQTEDAELNNAWNNLYSGVNNSNRLIFQFESLVQSGDVNEADAAKFISELKVLRGFYYYQLLDGWGNVPLVTSFADAPENPSQESADFQQGRTAVFDFVVDEVKSNMDNLSGDAASTYGRFNKWAAHMLLAKLYLNANVYRGISRTSQEYQNYLDLAVAHCDSIIDSGNYSLVSNYSDNFVANNSGSPELIFVVPYDEVFLKGFNLDQMTLHYASQATYNLDQQPWNGYAAMQETYDRYIDPTENPGPQGDVIDDDGSTTTGTLDERLSNFIVGPQYDAQGNRLEDPGATDADPDGKPLTFTPHIEHLEPNGLRQAGARIGKFEFEKGAKADMNNDYPIFRYADVLLMKAEALWRLNQQPAEALRLVNLIRERANVDDYASLDAQKILDERGREMFWEVTRRQDLIRFQGDQGTTKFNDPWTFKPNVTDQTVNVFPIPRDQLEANTNLVQNPGY